MLEKYNTEAKEKWGNTEAYGEYTEKTNKEYETVLLYLFYKTTSCGSPPFSLDSSARYTLK